MSDRLMDWKNDRSMVWLADTPLDWLHYEIEDFGRDNGWESSVILCGEQSGIGVYASSDAAKKAAESHYRQMILSLPIDKVAPNPVPTAPSPDIHKFMSVLYGRLKAMFPDAAHGDIWVGAGMANGELGNPHQPEEGYSIGLCFKSSPTFFYLAGEITDIDELIEAVWERFVDRWNLAGEA